MGYSQDLRDRVIDTVMLESMSRRAAAHRFGVSECSAIRWVRRYEETGHRTAIGTGGHRRSVCAQTASRLSDGATDRAARHHVGADVPASCRGVRGEGRYQHDEPVPAA